MRQFYCSKLAYVSNLGITLHQTRTFTSSVSSGHQNHTVTTVGRSAHLIATTHYYASLPHRGSEH